MCVYAVEYVSANSALEEVYGILRNSYMDVESDRRNDSDRDRKKYDDDAEEEVWRILDVEEIRHSTSAIKVQLNLSVCSCTSPFTNDQSSILFCH